MNQVLQEIHVICPLDNANNHKAHRKNRGLSLRMFLLRLGRLYAILVKHSVVEPYGPEFLSYRLFESNIS